MPCAPARFPSRFSVALNLFLPHGNGRLFAVREKHLDAPRGKSDPSVCSAHSGVTRRCTRPGFFRRWYPPFKNRKQAPFPSPAICCTPRQGRICPFPPTIYPTTVQNSFIKKPKRNPKLATLPIFRRILKMQGRGQVSQPQFKV